MANAIVSRKAMIAAFYLLSNNSSDWTFHLFDNNFTPDVDSVVGDFTEASYDTYPAGGRTLAHGALAADGNQERFPTAGTSFPAPTASGPVTIYGFYVLFDSYPASPRYEVLASARFPSPIVLTNGGAELPLIFDCASLDLNNP